MAEDWDRVNGTREDVDELALVHSLSSSTWLF